MGLLMALRWPVVILLLGLFVILAASGVVDRWLDLRQRDQDLGRREVEIEHAEKALTHMQVRHEQEVAKATTDEEVGLRKAQLRQRAAKANAAAELAEDPELLNARKAGELRAIGAIGDARARLAEEFVREQHRRDSLGLPLRLDEAYNLCGDLKRTGNEASRFRHVFDQPLKIPPNALNTPRRSPGLRGSFVPGTFQLQIYQVSYKITIIHIKHE